MHLHVQNLSAHRNDFDLFQKVNFELKAGQVLSVIGENGIGKTTLLRILAGLYPAQQGNIHFFNEQKKAKISHHSFYLGHKNILNGHLTLWQNLTFWQNYFHVPHLSITDILRKESLHPFETIPFSSLSNGQQRRAALCLLHLSPRQIWLLDEPTTNLDQKAQNRLYQNIKNHCKKGGIVIIATHSHLAFSPDVIINLQDFQP